MRDMLQDFLDDPVLACLRIRVARMIQQPYRSFLLFLPLYSFYRTAIHGPVFIMNEGALSVFEIMFFLYLVNPSVAADRARPARKKYLR